MNVFKEMALSIYSYGTYSQFLKNKKGKVFGFGVLLSTLFFVITVLIPSLMPSGIFFSLSDDLRDILPDFKLEGDTLWVDNVVQMDSGSSYIYVDTDSDLLSNDTREWSDVFKGYQSVILVDEEKVITKSDGQWQVL